MSDRVYYDESCYVCSLEINALRKRGEACGIEFVDISSPDFNEDEDYETEMIGEFNGKTTVGLETVISMYEKIGFKRLASLFRLPVVSSISNVGYRLFAYGIRPCLPKKKKERI